MQVEKFTKSDIPDAVGLTVDAWRNTLDGWKDAVAETVCEYSVRDEFLNENYALKITDEGVMKGFIFAATASDKNDADDWLREQMSQCTDKDDLEIYEMVMSASYNNEMRVVQHLGGNDVMLTFFLSSQRGCGSMLLSEMMRLLHAEGFENCYLWTDVTCNHQYYPKHGFTLVEKVVLQDSPDEQPFVVYIYKKPVSVK